MRLKKLFLLVAAMVLSIPTMFAQEPVYFAYNTSTGKFNSLTQAGQLTYNADSQTYTGQIEMVQSSADGNKAVIFYTGSADNPTYIGSGMVSMQTGLKKASATNLATRNQAYGWYISLTDLQAWDKNADTKVEQTFNVTLNMNGGSPVVSFDLVISQEAPEVPENFYVWVWTGTAYVNAGTLSPTQEGGTTFTGTINTSLNDQRFLLSPVGTDWRPGTAYGQQGDTSGSSQTSDVKLTTPGQSAKITMVEGTTSTQITNPGEYTFEFDYATLSLTVTLVNLNGLYPSQLRVVHGSLPSSFNSPSSSDAVLTRQSDGTYVGSFQVTSRTDYFKFYGTTNGVTTYFGPATAANMNFNTASVVNQTVTNADAVTGVQYWAVGTFPQNNFVTTGTVTALVNLEAGTVEFTLEPGTPATLYLHTTSAPDYRPTSNVAATPTDGIFTWELEGPAYFLES